MKYVILFFAFFSGLSASNSQSHVISGEVQSATDQSTIPGATVVLEHLKDSSMINGVVTDFNGHFDLTKVQPGNYLLRFQFVGFKTHRIPVNITQDLNVGVVKLDEETTELEEIVVTAKRMSSQQKGDTTQFNADAFKTLNDASGKDLVQKMPGITVQDGTIQAQGEQVTQILVDGKPFFGTDVQAALQNLPAEVIQSIQVFDKKSDKAELSGFDDGERQKTINIVTKPNRRKGQFGKSTGGYGSNQRYLLGTSVNLFNEDRRITITGLSNNVNAIEYSADPNSQGESRTQDGIITTNIIGVNFSDDLGEKIELTGSYLFSHKENEGYSSLTRGYVLTDNNQVYRQESKDNKKNMDHVFNLRFDYDIDSMNRIIVRPNVSLKHDNNNSHFLGNTQVDSGPLNQTENLLTSSNSDYDFNNWAYYSHKFRKKGRAFTFGLHTGYHTNKDDADRLGENVYYGEEEKNQTLVQKSHRDRAGISWEGQFSYTEPIGEKGQMELEYEIGNKLNDSDMRTYDVTEELNQPEPTYVLDSALSNTFKSDYMKHEAEIGYQYRHDKLRFVVEAEYQQAQLQNEQFFPKPYEMQPIFQSILPTVRVDYEFSKTNRIEFDYDTWTREPYIGQLQEVIDNSNPLHLRTGNPDLDQSMNNRFRIRYRGHDPEKEKSFFVYLASSFIQDNITNNTLVAESEIEVSEGVVLQPGSQLSRPVNVDGYWDFRSYVNFGRPIERIKSNMSVFGSINYTNNPAMVNNEVNFVKSGNIRAGFSFSSNISENVDFYFRTRSSFNDVENTLQPSLSTNYFNQSTQFSYDWIIWRGLTYRMDLNHQVNAGLSEGYDTNFLLLNASIGKRIFNNQRGEISMNVYDLLAQNSNIRRNVTEVYVEDIQSNVLQRYFMLTFTYNFRHFSKGTTMEDYEKLHSQE